MRTLLLAVALCLAASGRLGWAQDSPAAAQAQPATLHRVEVPLDPFSEVSLCAPISTLIKPNTTGDGYSLVMEAEDAVVKALTPTVADGALRLETSADFNTTRPIKLTVSMPAGALRAVSHQGTGAELFIAPGFNIPEFSANASFGAGRLYVDGMVAQNVTNVLSSTGDVVLSGSFGTVNVTTTGTGALYVQGFNDSLLLDMRGVSDAFAEPAQPSATVTGTAQGLNTVQYSGGTCSVESAFGPALVVCQQVPYLSVFPLPIAVWTCGLRAQGAFKCSADGMAFTSAAGVDTSSGPPGTFPTVAQRQVTGPSSFALSGASPAGPGTGVQQQAGSVTPQGTTAQSAVAGTGSVSTTSVAGPGGAQTSTSQGGQTTAFQTTGQGTVGTLPAGAQSASASSTAFSSALASSGGAAGSQGAGGGGVVRVAPGTGQATAASDACQAFPLELSMPTQG